MQSMNGLLLTSVFQFTHPRGVRWRIRHIPLYYSCFNSRTREGCDIESRLTKRYIRCFNSRTREGCDLIKQLEARGYGVSIHAPARGAIIAVRKLGPCKMFQFTHPRGVRFVLLVVHLLTKCFNSRTREGCDFFIHRGDSVHDVSIHAPARGAIDKRRSMVQMHGFNSRTREGCDEDSFQGLPVYFSFNSRTREGCDLKPSYS